MPVHKWRRMPTQFFGEVLVPFAQVELRKTDGTFQAIILQIDSGAIVSLLSKSVAELLGLELEKGKRVELGSVGGQRTTAFVHVVHARFDEGIHYPVRFAFATKEDVPNLLGRLDVFDTLQISFDATLAETRVTPPWLSPDDRRIYKLLLETESDILSRYGQLTLPFATREALRRMFHRIAQLFASAVSLMTHGCVYAGPMIVRAMWEASLQMEYLLRDPDTRGQLYLDFEHITRYKQSKTVVDNPIGPIGRKLASSPKRAEGERRNQAEYDRVKRKFLRPRKSGSKEKVADNWYIVGIRDLAKQLGREGEYNLVYAQCAAWAHCDSFGSRDVSESYWVRPDALFWACFQYYSRVLLSIAECGKLLLTDEQYEALRIGKDSIH